ncbi:tape measure protein [Aquincola sp. J276]|uniref:tape measure protein n=1 Tax=Aquincola sp. J276 TaxID=2898432 RepID=UPI002151BC35|nr:tape measure protein [Aquincola sp. J276]MCR5865220.1 tape measure protein [Aquincola sp. J276]
MSENVGTGSIKLTGDATGFKAAIADAKQSATGLGKELGNSTQAGAAKGKAAVDQYIARLRVAADNIGKTASQIKLQELAQRGATQAQLETAAAALKTLDAYKQQQAAARQAAAASNQASAGALAMRNALAGLSVAALGREFIQAADAMTNLNARLALVATGYANFQRAQREVIAIAQETRTGLGQTADLFTSLSRSTEALGVSQSDVLGVTRTINQALVVSGANAESAAAALVQLGQGFASGTLRGEELNSVLEQAPRLARAIADGMGVTVGQLRDLGKAGKLTAEQVFQAIQKGGAAINSEFERMPLTVGPGHDPIAQRRSGSGRRDGQRQRRDGRAGQHHQQRGREGDRAGRRHQARARRRQGHRHPG